MTEMTSNVLFSNAKMVAEVLQSNGASKCLMVGGCVRDHIMGVEFKDIDLEVYGLSLNDIVRILQERGFGTGVNLVGQAFGVVKLMNGIDVSIPRRDSKNGIGHQGFDVTFDPTMTPMEAAARRDFTINSLAMDFDGNIHDFFDGIKDIKNKTLSATSHHFCEDPLRVLRAFQFAGRFGFTVDGGTAKVCRDIADEFKNLSVERVHEEWFKWATKSRFPSMGIKALSDMGWLELFPELSVLDGLEQDPVWHPEGDTLVHTMHVCDAAAEIAERDGLNETDRFVLLMSSLCHDLGKATTTCKNDDGRWIAPAHAAAGAEPTRRFMARIMKEASGPVWDELVENQIVPLVEEHMTHIGIDVPSMRTARRLAVRLKGSNFNMWSRVVEADHSGRPPLPKANPALGWMKVAEEVKVVDGQPKPVVQGRDLIAMGMKPGPQFGRILKAAFEAQLDGEISSVEDFKNWFVGKEF